MTFSHLYYLLRRKAVLYGLIGAGNLRAPPEVAFASLIGHCHT